VRGVSLEEAARGAEAERRAHAETLWRFVFKGNLVGGHFNADPHPGNFLFGPDGRVSFLDFGCVEPLPADRVKHARRLHAAAVRRDEAAFREVARHILDTRPGVWEDQAIAYSRRCFEPLFGSPFRITRSYAGELVTSLREMTKGIRKLPEGESVSMPKGMLFMNRLQFGFYSVLARLDVEVDYAAVERTFYEEAGLSIDLPTDAPA
jgi:predicted unusual protein kinase regulating ubiquinone biosynthesis (AarF/ABC1/UbiB family)